MARSGQVTLFIIIGILLLLTALAVFWLAQERIPSVDSILGRGEGGPVQTFVTSCLRDAAKEGIQRLGERGGYIEPRLSANARQPTDGDGIPFAPGSQYIIPYWFHMASPNTCGRDCQFVKRRPPLHRADGTGSIEEQLEAYISSRLIECAGGFAAAGLEGTAVTPTGEPRVRVTVGDQDVSAIAQWPLDVRTAESTQTLDAFASVLDVNLREMYEMADRLSSLQDEHRYLEKAARNLIDSFSGTDPGKLPPITDLTFDRAGGVTWQKQEVRERLTDILATYIPFIQVFGTRDYRYITPPLSGSAVRDIGNFDVYYNRNFLIPLTDELHPSVSAHFSYLDWWPAYFDLNCRGNLCEPSSIAHTYGFSFFMQRYAFSYDLSFPVLLSLANPDAFDGEGFTFNLMLEANMRANQPFRADTLVYEPSGIAAGSLLCDPAQRTSPNVTVEIREKATAMPVEASLALTCGGETCDLGLARDGMYTGPLPRCLNGAIGAFAPDRPAAWTPIDTYVDAPQTRLIELGTFHDVNLTIKHYGMYKVGDGNWQLDRTRALPLDENDVSIIQLELQEGPLEEPYATAVQLQGSYAPNERRDTSVRLTPGKYLVRIGTLHYPAEPFIVPPEVDCQKYRTGRSSYDCTCFAIPDEPVIFDTNNPLPIGGAEFLWDVRPEHLDGTHEIELHAFRFMLDRVPLSCASRQCLPTSPTLSFSPDEDYYAGAAFAGQVQQAINGKTYIDCSRDASDFTSFAIQTEGVSRANPDLLPPIARK